MSITHSLVTQHAMKEFIRLGEQTYRDHFADIWTSKGLEIYLHDQFNADKLATDLKDDSILYYVTRLDANPVGVIKLKLDQPIPGVEGQNGMELEKIYLRREFVGQGIGSNMMEMCLTLARDHHEDNIWLNVLKSNQRGIKFYQSYGYDIVGEIEFSTDLLNIGMFVMSKDLTNS